MSFSFLKRLKLFHLRLCHVVDLWVDHVVVLLSLSQCTVCSAQKGVTNGGTIVHCEAREEQNGKKRTEQLFTARGEIEKKV